MPDKRTFLRWLAIAWVASNLAATAFCAGGSLLSVARIAWEKIK